MKKACEKWKDRLLEAALTGITPEVLEEHVRGCANCSVELHELRARRVQLDTLLPLMAQGTEPSGDFRARVLAAAERAGAAKRVRLWTWAVAAAAVVAALMAGLTLTRRYGTGVSREELATAQKLAEWRAPSDGLLRTPGQEWLRATPRLGHSYLPFARKTDEEK